MTRKRHGPSVGLSQLGFNKRAHEWATILHWQIDPKIMALIQEVQERRKQSKIESKRRRIEQKRITREHE